MKPKFFKISLILCSVFLWSGISSADIISIGFSSGNDNEKNVDLLIDLVKIYNSEKEADLPYDLTLLGKWDKNKWTESNDDIVLGFTGDFTGKSGTWSATGWDPATPLFYSLKGGDGFGLYYTQGLTSGDWEIDFTNNGGQIPALSHISFWKADGNIPVNPPTNPVPEPGTLALVGLGLATIAGYRRKRRSS